MARARKPKKAPKGKSAKAKPSHKALGHAVAAIRDQRGLTQAEVSKKTGLHVTYISGIENGSRNPSWTVLTQISQALRIKLSELVKQAEALDNKQS